MLEIADFMLFRLKTPNDAWNPLFALMSVLSRNGLPGNPFCFPESDFFCSAEVARTVYFCSQGVLRMSRICLRFRFFACFVLFSWFAALAQQSATTPPGPVPPAILAAKKIFLSNSGAPYMLYSGGSNRAYNQLFAALQASGFFEMATDPSEADLVLELQIFDSGPGSATFRLLIYDRKTHFLLWTLLEPISACGRQKTCDANFDEALPVLLLNFEKLTGKAPGAAH